MPEEIERRRMPRVVIGGRVESALQPRLDTTLIDLNLKGACVEHLVLLRPGSLCELLIKTEPQELCLRARAVWSQVHRSVKQPEGEPDLIYRTGVEFLDLTREQQAQLAILLQTFQAGGASNWTVVCVLL